MFVKHRQFGGRKIMSLLAARVIIVWSGVALILGLCLGALIRAGKRLPKDDVRVALFATRAGESMEQ
jgi:hypothetical protein